MRLHPDIEKWRIRQGYWGTEPGCAYGAFLIPGPCSRDLQVLASDGTPEVPWEHVSVSLSTRTPNWQEMCFVKDHFWDDEEVVMQLHPPRSKWVNNHRYCLHLWKPKGVDIPLPPDILVGLKDLGDITEIAPLIDERTAQMGLGI